MGTQITIDMTALGAKGGKARAKKLNPTRRKEIAAAAGMARWEKARKKKAKRKAKAKPHKS